jgi:homogentisate 1,2-dioxygenase
LRFLTFLQPIPLPDKPTDFVDGLHAVLGAGDPTTKSGICIYLLSANKSMTNRAFCNSDGDFLFVAQEGSFVLVTEMGRMHVAPGEIAVVPRGIRFALQLDAPVRAYLLEIYDGHFAIPDLGPIGSNGLANPRDFQTPVAWYEDRDCQFELVQKFGGQLQSAEYDHSVFDVVAWHGNYVPFKYDLAHFNTINSVSFDHPDPSIYTVLTCQSNTPGVAVADFVVFPPRWLVMEHSFRPPWFHRNCMTEFMGLIKGSYEAKEGGFVPGGASLHSCMAPHG